MLTLNNSQRNQLKRLAHHLDPIVYIGKNGVTDALVDSTRKALEAHELIKLRFTDNKDRKKEIMAEIEEKTQSALVAIIGHVAILYRQQEDEEKRKIELKRP